MTFKRVLAAFLIVACSFVAASPLKRRAEEDGGSIMDKLKNSPGPGGPGASFGGGGASFGGGGASFGGGGYAAGAFSAAAGGAGGVGGSSGGDVAVALSNVYGSMMLAEATSSYIVFFGLWWAYWYQAQALFAHAAILVQDNIWALYGVWTWIAWIYTETWFYIVIAVSEYGGFLDEGFEAMADLKARVETLE